MAGTADGSLKRMASRAGLSVTEYAERQNSGQKFCWRCSIFHVVTEFGKDSTRPDGLDSACRESRNAASRRTYSPKPRPERGRRFVPVRDGDTKQARGRVNYLVNAGLLPDPDDLPCKDCGHVRGPGERRHEYDHHHGYLAKHHECVEAVCTTCHVAREAQRRADKRRLDSGQ